MLKSRTVSTPINVPKVTSHRRKSILKTPSHLLSSSLDSDTPASSPECSTSVRRLSHVRFFDETADCERTLAQKKGNSVTQRRSDVTSSHRASLPTFSCGCDVIGAPLSDAVLGLSVLRMTSSMSPEARYAAVKTFEDNLCERLEHCLPDVAQDLKRCRTPDDDVSTDDSSDVDFTAPPLPDATRVAKRLHDAVDVLVEFSQSNSSRKLSRSSVSCSRCDSVSVKARLFSDWCVSLRATLDELISTCK